MDARLRIERLLEKYEPRLRVVVPYLGPMTALAASLFMVVFLAVASSRNVVHAQHDPQPLAAERRDAGDIELRWDAHDPKLAQADEAILTIIDGGSERSEYLNGDAIQRGSYRYHRRSWDVSFCLRAFHNGRKAYVDDVRLFDSAPADPGDVTAFAATPGQTYVQVAAVPKHDAEDLGRALAAQKFGVAYEAVQGGTGWYRVMVGPVQRESELPGTIAELRQTGLVESVPFVRKF
jgi:hypothetical protein